ncbi:hypothetical protein B0T18DRAFT_388938 [Schizothecium vesticola]|uniref:Uncharacterized protein n=1 Tax=Schizothecium vesticola TaxID=314040 RepID=A0AA40F1J1_9PEZI|nr:hypothetical protein B0T18DRAFT_388938 [Schizothecium vesticola]
MKRPAPADAAAAPGPAKKFKPFTAELYLSKAAVSQVPQPRLLHPNITRAEHYSGGISLGRNSTLGTANHSLRSVSTSSAAAPPECPRDLVPSRLAREAANTRQEVVKFLLLAEKVRTQEDVSAETEKNIAEMVRASSPGGDALMVLTFAKFKKEKAKEERAAEKAAEEDEAAGLIGFRVSTLGGLVSIPLMTHSSFKLTDTSDTSS